jgi:hypothetical protein
MTADGISTRTLLPRIQVKQHDESEDRRAFTGWWGWMRYKPNDLVKPRVLSRKVHCKTPHQTLIISSEVGILLNNVLEYYVDLTQ